MELLWLHVFLKTHESFFYIIKCTAYGWGCMPQDASPGCRQTCGSRSKLMCMLRPVCSNRTAHVQGDNNLLRHFLGLFPKKIKESYSRGQVSHTHTQTHRLLPGASTLSILSFTKTSLADSRQRRKAIYLRVHLDRSICDVEDIWRAVVNKCAMLL